MIIEHNKSFQRPDDCEEALLTILRKPKEGETPDVILVGKLMKKLNFEAKYVAENEYKNELDILGQNMNELSETLEKNIKELKSANIALKKDIARKPEYGPVYE